jgi:hypothetical protein
MKKSISPEIPSLPDYRMSQADSKPKFADTGHAKRSEESHIFDKLRFFRAFRMTEKAKFKIALGTS